MPWNSKQPDLKNNPAYLEPRVTAVESSLAQIALSITQFGANANDQTFDNISVIQATINAVHTSGGGTVYIPPYNTYYVKPTSSNYITLYDNVFIEGGVGSVVKVIDNAGDYPYIFHSTNNGDRLRFTNVTVDSNVQKNTSCNIATNTTSQTVIRAEQPGELKVTGCKFLNCGSTCTIETAGGYDTAFIDISDNYFQFVRGASTTSNYDVSVIYFDAFQAIVKNNRFISNSVSLPNTAMEVHADVLEMSGNYVTYHNCGILPLLPVYATKYSLMRWDFHDNHFDNVRNGVYPYIMNFGNYANSTITQFTNINIHHNSFRLNPAVYGTTVGSHALYFVNYLPSNFTIDHLVFESNDIIYAADTVNGNRTESIISNDDAIQFTTGFNFQNIIISDNRFTNAPSMGIQFSTSGSVSNVLIRNNHAVNLGCGLSQQANDYYKSFLRVGNVASLSNVVLDNNTIIDTGNPVNTCYFVSLYSYSQVATTANMLIRANNKLNSANGSIGCMPVWSGDDESRKSVFEWSRVSYLSSTTSPPNGTLLHQSDIMVTPSKVYSVNGDCVTGSLQTVSAGTVTATTTSGSNVITVNDATNIKAGMILKITDGTNTVYPQVKYVWSPTQIIVATAPSVNITSGTVTYNAAYYTDVYKGNYGTVNLAANASTATVSHGCPSTPTSVVVTPQGNVGNCWVTSINSTQFTINVSTTNASVIPISWRAQV